MSDLRPTGVKVKLGGQERTLLFTVNAIDSIQEKCNLPLYDAIGYVAKAADGNTEHDTLMNFRTIVTALLKDDGDENITEKEVGRMLTLENYSDIAAHVLQAFGISMPDPDEEDEDEDEDEHPNVVTGQ